MKLVYKKIEQNSGTITFYHTGKWKKLYYAIPEWNRKKIDAELEEYFIHQNRRYYLSEFVAVHNFYWNPNPPGYMTEFDGYMNDSFFSGYAIKVDLDEERVKVFLFIS